MKALANMLGIAGAVALALVVIGGLGYGSVELYAWLGPKQAEAERNVFVNTPSYIIGKDQTLSGYRRQYRTAKDKTSKAAIRDAALDEASTVEISKLTSDNRAFIEELRDSK